MYVHAQTNDVIFESNDVIDCEIWTTAHTDESPRTYKVQCTSILVYNDQAASL